MEDPQDVQITLGGIAIFRCSVQSDEEPSIVWMKEEKELIPDERKYKLMENGTLIIRNTEESDVGYYECLAKNPEGEVRSRKARMLVHSQVLEDQQLSPYGEYKTNKITK